MFRAKLLLAIGLLFHSVLLSPVIVKVLAELCLKLDVTRPVLAQYHIPHPAVWEYFWSASLIFIVIGVYALCFENYYKMAMFIIGHTLFAVLPIASLIISHHHDAFRGLPVDYHRYAFALLCLPVHVSSLYYASVLRRTWKLEATTTAVALVARKKQ